LRQRGWIRFFLGKNARQKRQRNDKDGDYSREFFLLVDGKRLEKGYQRLQELEQEGLLLLLLLRHRSRENFFF